MSSSSSNTNSANNNNSPKQQTSNFYSASNAININSNTNNNYVSGKKSGFTLEELSTSSSSSSSESDPHTTNNVFNSLHPFSPKDLSYYSAAAANNNNNGGSGAAGTSNKDIFSKLNALRIGSSSANSKPFHHATKSLSEISLVPSNTSDDQEEGTTLSNRTTDKNFNSTPPSKKNLNFAFKSPGSVPLNNSKGGILPQKKQLSEDSLLLDEHSNSYSDSKKKSPLILKKSSTDSDISSIKSLVQVFNVSSSSSTTTITSISSSMSSVTVVSNNTLDDISNPTSASNSNQPTSSVGFNLLNSPSSTNSSPMIHPEIIRLGLRYAKHKILGGNARCIEMLKSFKIIIRDYKTPSGTAINRHLDSHFKPLINYLVSCRPLSTSMGNAIKHLKSEIANLSPDIPEETAKQNLYEIIDTFIRDRIILASVLIIQHGCTKIHDGDVVLVYAQVSVVTNLLIHSHKQGKKFRAIVVDSRPWLEGRVTCKLLSDAGIHTTYTLLNAISYVIQEVTKIFLGAHCIYSNGTILSRVGTSIVAMTGYDHNVPVIVCCETYKFTDRVQLESGCLNEFGDANQLRPLPGTDASKLPHYALSNPLHNQYHNNNNKDSVEKSDQTHSSRASDNFSSSSTTAFSAKRLPIILNIMHDICPAKYINMIITEIGMIPCTSVPVVLREYRSFNPT